MTSLTPETGLPSSHLLRQLIDAIAAHPEVREPLLRVLLTEDFLTLPNRVDKLQDEFAEFREETSAGFRTVNQRLDENTHAIRTLEGHVGRLIGHTYEDRCRNEIGVILDGWLDGPVLADRSRINAQLLQARKGGAISRDQYLDGLRLDIIAREVEDTDQTGRLAVVEVSVTFNRGDLENAARRAAVISSVTGANTDAFVATHGAWPDEVDSLAQLLGVTIIRHEDPEYVNA